MINYIIQVMLFQLLFLAIYDLFLKKETFFTGNRIYLLITPLLSFIVPFMKVAGLQTEYTHEVSILLPEIVLSPQTVIENSEVVRSVDPNYSVLIFWIGFALLLGLFLFRLFKLISLIRRNPVQVYKEFRLVQVKNSRKAFSFFNYIFLGDGISEEDKEKILVHEMVHSRQKHSADLILFEVLKIVMWFNPLFYIFQKRIAAVHEYISDSTVIKNSQREQYINTLLNEFFEVDSFSFINQFSKKSILKNRIIMMTKDKSKEIMRAKYLVLLPLFVGMLFYISCSEEFQTSEKLIAKKQVQKTYLLSQDGLKETSKEQESTSYFDLVILISESDIPADWKTITRSDLSKEELVDYYDQLEKVKEIDVKTKSKTAKFEYKLYRDSYKRAVIGIVPKFNYDKVTSIQNNDNTNTITEAVPFVLIDKIPTFPGCSENDKDCFTKEIQMHFAKSFDKNLPRTLDLSSGKKRVITTFQINKYGLVENIKVKSPSPKLDEEVRRVVQLLPKMIPGENDGKKVSVKYTLPLRIDVE